MGLPNSSQPLNPGLNFATINAETLDEASREMEFNVPEDKVIDRVRTPDSSIAAWEMGNDFQ